ncbi:hypothetical protein F5146DRAFT_554769 [Armillaria mellea]|nr:hypothetical protein F5146DRAFT_554769 [Armillaria mellea]
MTLGTKKKVRVRVDTNLSCPCIFTRTVTTNLKLNKPDHDGSTSTNNASLVSLFTYRQPPRPYSLLRPTNALKPMVMSHGAPESFPPLADVLKTISADFHGEFLNWMRGCAAQNDKKVSLTGVEAVITQLLDTIPPCGSVSTAEAARKMAPVPTVLESIGEVLGIDNWREPPFVWMVVSGLLRLMTVMESWKKEAQEAASLLAKAFDRIVDILQNIGGTFVKGIPQNDQRSQLREMFEECRHVMHVNGGSNAVVSNLCSNNTEAKNAETGRPDGQRRKEYMPFASFFRYPLLCDHIA